jgi:hypothetical protein
MIGPKMAVEKRAMMMKKATTEMRLRTKRASAG